MTAGRQLTIEPTDAAYRRRIELRPADGLVEASMEDYVHHMAVRLRHRDGVVEAAEVASARLPWSSCAAGTAGVGRLGGVRLDAVADLGWTGGRTHQCVHTTDLVVLAAAAALRGRPTTYEVWLTGIGRRRMEAQLLRDGREWGTWALVDGELVDEGRFAGLRLPRREFVAWTADHLEPDDAEAAAVLRRGLHIGLSRGIDPTAWAHPDEARPGDDSCLTYGRDVAGVAVSTVRVRATERDGAGAPTPPAGAWRSV